MTSVTPTGQGGADGAGPLAYPDALIRKILSETKTVAMVGASAKEIRPSYFVLKYLLAKGFGCLAAKHHYAAFHKTKSTS